MEKEKKTSILKPHSSVVWQLLQYAHVRRILFLERYAPILTLFYSTLLYFSMRVSVNLGWNVRTS